MRGAALETSQALLEHLARRLAVLIHELAVADEAPGDGCLWGLQADLAALGDVVEVLRERERFSHQRHAGGQRARG